MLSLLNKQITETLQFTYSGLPITRPLKEVKKKGSNYQEFRTTNRKEGRMQHLLYFYSYSTRKFSSNLITENSSENGTVHSQ